jgi:hypothetical protein
MLNKQEGKAKELCTILKDSGVDESIIIEKSR